MGVCLPPLSAHPGVCCTVGLRHTGWICLPGVYLPAFNGRFRRPAGVSLLRRPVAVTASSGMLTASSIGSAARLCLRSRLTLIRLALIRKPWSFGVRVSRPHYRYLYLHLLFRMLHGVSRHCFNANRNAPLPTACLAHDSTASVPDLCPIIIHARPLDR